LICIVNATGFSPFLYRGNSRTRYGEIPVDFALQASPSWGMQANTSKPVAETSTRGLSMALIIDILRGSRELLYHASALYLQTEANRARLSKTLMHMSEQVHELYDKLDAGQLPGGTCYKLEQLSYQLHHSLEPILGQLRAQALCDKFIQTRRIGLLHHDLAAGTIGTNELILLQAAANHLHDTAKKLKAHLL
jgi:hypothetical protein